MILHQTVVFTIKSSNKMNFNIELKDTSTSKLSEELLELPRTFYKSDMGLMIQERKVRPYQKLSSLVA
jgi:hypothetical protein